MIKKIFYKLFGRKIRLVEMTEKQELSIFNQISNIKGIEDFWEYQRQKAFQVYASTKEERFLGYADMATQFLRFMDEREESRKNYLEEEKENNGYEPMIS